MIHFNKNSATFIFLTVICAGVNIGCGSDDSGEGQAAQCASGETWNPLLGSCQLESRNGSDAGTPEKDSDAGAQTNNLADTGADARPDDVEEDGDTTSPEVENCWDQDRDGYYDVACGGTDCDDHNPAVHPGAVEVCDALDNNCDGQLNDGLTCSFFAHSPTKLYLVDPFKKTATYVTDVPTLSDIDTHPGGTLYGITFSDLYRFNAPQSTWERVGALNATGTPNGLAINNDGVAFLTSGDKVFTVDLSTGNASALGTIGGGLRSSGDCVVNKDNSLFMTSPAPNFGAVNDVLVSISPSGQGTRIGGDLGFADIYGLTAAWQRMFGLGGGGELVEINSGSGSATLIHRFDGIEWYGAASTPAR
ncbi:putative metal-binding motif-containing protein [Bradymonas sediminis]|uniref:Uncharacterized protein n=1 Tax=Bradymonas sediminis TaxID=1548548 RepID=A0A2Z4FLQ6_9DELT|nr:putative metal-binding motif-containing protein [Bradymonas sediminis]AWV89608.1 hypothetical protein DN745_09765 [Bradymonas sediminis]TDP76656.1 putative metal-binding protein [Bradymonas sediminis]